MSTGVQMVGSWREKKNKFFFVTFFFFHTQKKINFFFHERYECVANVGLGLKKTWRSEKILCGVHMSAGAIFLTWKKKNIFHLSTEKKKEKKKKKWIFFSRALWMRGEHETRLKKNLKHWKNFRRCLEVCKWSGVGVKKKINFFLWIFFFQTWTKEKKWIFFFTSAVSTLWAYE